MSFLTFELGANTPALRGSLFGQPVDWDRAGLAECESKAEMTETAQSVTAHAQGLFVINRRMQP